MSKPLSFKSGDHWVECQRCGFVHRESRMREEWTGLIVCGECWEPRHPLDFVKGLSDDQSPDGLVNPESSDTFKDEPFDTSLKTSIPDGTFNGDL